MTVRCDSIGAALQSRRRILTADCGEEGIESALKRAFNKMQSDGRQS